MTHLADVLRSDIPLAPLTTYKVGGAARWFSDVHSHGDLSAVLAATPGVPRIVLGRGSNLVFADSGFDGLVIRLSGSFQEATCVGDIIDAGGGMTLPKLARFAAASDRGGLEFFIGIPGSVGGAVRMNAGGHGSDTAAVLVGVTILRFEASAAESVPVDALDLAYRSSNLDDGDIVLSARFRTSARSRDDVERELRDITRWRKEHQPGGTLNAGSVFKNPPGDASGRIIDSLGLKGYRRGAVAISDLHANFFVADRGATAQDIWDLVWDVRRRVGEETGTWLEPEIRFVGDFGPRGDDNIEPAGYDERREMGG